MKKSEYWSVEYVSGGSQYNDPVYYAIKNGEGEVIAKDCSRDLLEKICKKHNACFLEE